MANTMTNNKGQQIPLPPADPFKAGIIVPEGMTGEKEAPKEEPKDGNQ